MKSIAKRGCLSVILGGLVLALAGGANAQVSGYLTDSRGGIVKDAFGLCWRTSAWTPASAIAECDPELVPKKAPASAPARPVPPSATPPAKPAAPRAAPVADKVTLAADALFDFNKAELKPEGRSKLAALVASLKGIRLDTIIAVGHTDRIGSAAYNQKLSVKRADAVKAYLVANGVAANRVYTEGAGSKRPVTKPGQCKGSKKTAKLIACLQPDRRVEIEVVGTRTR